MPKVIEQLVRHEHSGQVWYSTRPVQKSDFIQEPSHLVKGVSASPVQKDNFTDREPD